MWGIQNSGDEGWHWYLRVIQTGMKSRMGFVLYIKADGGDEALSARGQKGEPIHKYTGFLELLKP